MTVKEFYDAISGDYEGVVARLSSEMLVKKFLFKFLSDGTYDTLVKALEAGDFQEAFRAAHTIKGVCQNLNLGKLQESSTALTESLRNGKHDNADELAKQVAVDYAYTIEQLKELQKSSI